MSLFNGRALKPPWGAVIENYSPLWDSKHMCVNIKFVLKTNAQSMLSINRFILKGIKLTYSAKTLFTQLKLWCFRNPDLLITYIAHENLTLN